MPPVNVPINPNPPTTAKDIADVQAKTSPSSLTSPTVKESDKAAAGTVRSVTEKDGVKTVVSSVSQEEADKAAKVANSGGLVAENLTQSREGVPGNTNLTQGGTLNSDKSTRDARKTEEVNKEAEEKAGPNPSPNRDGNELTKASNALTQNGPQFVGKIDRDTSKIAEELTALAMKTSLSSDDQKRLKEMAKELHGVGKL